jgi:V8-like Glu-specific endopeptidase
MKRTSDEGTEEHVDPEKLPIQEKRKESMTPREESVRSLSQKSEKTREEIEAYWTPERMAQAQPFPFPSPHSEGHPADKNRLLAAARPASTAFEEPGALTYETSQVPEKELEKYPYWSVGKLFCTFDGKDWTGSAAVVAANGLITAAHNLYNHKAKDPWAKNIMFCPAFTKGYANKAFGSWEARDITVPPEWKTKSGTERSGYDVGFIKLFPGGNRPIKRQIGEVVGRLPLVVEMAPLEDTTWLAVGYPAIAITGYDFDGDNMWLCKGDFKNWEGDVLGKNGNLTHGASGGPWLFNWKGEYVVNGVNSTVNQSHTANYSSFFGLWVEAMLNEFFG